MHIKGQVYRPTTRSNILPEKSPSDENKSENQTKTHMERCPTDPHCSLCEHSPENVMARQIGADSPDLKPQSKTVARPYHTQFTCSRSYSFSAFARDPAWKACLLWPHYNLIKPLSQCMAKFKKKMIDCKSKTIGCMCFSSAEMHMKIFLHPLSHKSHMFSRALCEWKPDLCDERRQILDMGYLFACTRSKTNVFQVDKVQTPGLERCCCHVGLFLIYVHTHVLSRVFYDSIMLLV